jgi:hypothetical protein
MTQLIPAVHARDLAITTLRRAIGALAEGNTSLAVAVLDQVAPASPDNTTATVAGCIATALGLLDNWLTGSDSTTEDLAQCVHLPAGHWLGQRAATDVLVLAQKGRAVRLLDTLITRQGGQHVLFGRALALGRHHPDLVPRHGHTAHRPDPHRRALSSTRLRSVILKDILRRSVESASEPTHNRR